MKDKDVPNETSDMMPEDVSKNDKLDVNVFLLHSVPFFVEYTA